MSYENVVGPPLLRYQTFNVADGIVTGSFHRCKHPIAARYPVHKHCGLRAYSPNRQDISRLIRALVEQGVGAYLH